MLLSACLSACLLVCFSGEACSVRSSPVPPPEAPRARRIPGLMLGSVAGLALAEAWGAAAEEPVLV